MLHALSYSFAHRRKKKGDMRRLWILRINAAARENGLTYSQLINGLTKIGSTINRKVLAEMALRDPDAFSQIVDQVRAETVKSTS
jgi:large subunit ribosomal protein L20